MGLKQGYRAVALRACCGGLNRTSVGLKHNWGPPTIRPNQPRPQSNQRGIETGDRCDFSQEIVEGLNRTSVGLKRGGKGGLFPEMGMGLNRTSVGLKQLLLDKQQAYVYKASIEPAWD